MSGTTSSAAQDDYIRAVLEMVEQIPSGKVLSYGDVAHRVGKGPRQVGWVMAHHGGLAPWWRVIYADGSPPGHHAKLARERWNSEKTPQRDNKVDMTKARWSN